MPSGQIPGFPAGPRSEVMRAMPLYPCAASPVRISMALASTRLAKIPDSRIPVGFCQGGMQLRLLLWLPHGVTMIDVNCTIIIIRTASLIPSAMILSGETPP